MSMKMGWRWYGEGNDPITLSDIKQIPGVEEIVWALHSKMPGEIWEEAEIKEVVDQIHAAGFDATVVESVNVHDDIKIGLPTRDKYIENYKQCIRNLSKFGVKTICYNFMPIFDWTRTDLFHPVGDGSTALFYQKDLIQDDYKGMANYILEFTEKYNMTFPGWEPERMAKLDELFKAYAPVTKEKLWDNLKYFLEAIMPTCRECDIKMAIHQDDPPWDIFGLPRLLVDAESIDRFLTMVDDPYNCLTLCSGSTVPGTARPSSTARRSTMSSARRNTCAGRNIRRKRTTASSQRAEKSVCTVISSRKSVRSSFRRSHSVSASTGRMSGSSCTPVCRSASMPTHRKSVAQAATAKRRAPFCFTPRRTSPTPAVSFVRTTMTKPTIAAKSALTRSKRSSPSRKRHGRASRSTSVERINRASR